MRALIIVDVQNDFCQGGALAVAGSNTIFPCINQMAKNQDFQAVIVTKDWHPTDHYSFAFTHGKQPFEQITDCHGQTQVLWPVHCVQGSTGSQLSPLLDIGLEPTACIQKGYIRDQQCYSGFGTPDHPTPLLQILQSHTIQQVVIVGLALDYCVGSTALDARRLGFKVVVVREGCKAVNEDTGRAMVEQFEKVGVKFVGLDQYWEEAKTVGSSEDSAGQN